MSQAISIFIICKNEEDIIGDCLEAARKVADEIILVDSGSTDRTLEIARTYTDKIYHQDWLGYGKQKNYALSLCSNDWVLSLDADEVLRDELINEIQNLDFKAGAYKIARKLYIKNKFIRWGGYYPDYQLRLFKRQEASFSEAEVHESVKFPKSIETKKLKYPLNHYAYDSLEDMQNSFNTYARLGHKPRGIFIAIIKAIYTFIYRFVFRLGFLDGILGLRLALIHSRYTFDKYN